MEKEYFRRVFVSYKACRSGFLNGCRPYLAVDATALNGRFRGQLASACAIDGHNWLFPIAYGVLETESEESWTWFLQNLHQVIGFPNGLVIHTDACKSLEIAVETVFPGVEHRECMRHLAANVNREKHRGKLVDDNLWPSSLTYSLKKHEYHLSQMYTNPKLKSFLQSNHKKLWARSKFNELFNVHYVNNNLAECFNSWIRNTKGLHLVDLLDNIKRMIMEKFLLHQRIAAAKFVGHRIILAVMKKLHDKTEGLRMTLVRRNPFEAEVTIVDKEKRKWRYPVNLQRKTYNCRQWQIIGLPCIHALYFITYLHGLACEIDQYVHEYYSVARFNATYADNIPTIERKHQWTTVDPGFVLHPPVQGRAPGRPRKVRIRSRAEGRTGPGPRKRKCKRCGGLGHIARTRKNAVNPAL